jgi:PTS system nitrogen regulatory IIA component
MSPLEIFRPGAIRVDVAAASKAGALAAAGRLMAAVTGLPARSVTRALLQREALGSTGFGGGLAVPHGRLPGATAIHGGILRLRHAIDFDSFDGQPVDLLIVLVGPETGGAEHLKALACVSRMLRADGFARRMQGAADAAALWALVCAHAGEATATP